MYSVLAELLASGLNANLGGRDHAPIELERQIIRWSARVLGFPETSSGLLVTGTSIANFIAVLVARTDILGAGVRERGILGDARGPLLRAYTSAATHSCVARAMDMAGFGTDALRLVAVDDDGRISAAQLEEMVAADRASGLIPFLVVGNAGTVDIGAIDDLAALSRFSAAEGLWFHVDGALAALGVLSERVAPLLAGIESADSIAFDFHKWGQVQYDAGCVLVRRGSTQLATFSHSDDYLAREARGLASGGIWPCDLGPDLSRGFRALKVWFTVSTLGAPAIGRMISHTCALAEYLAERVDAAPELERLAPVASNIVCFRYRFERESDHENAELVSDVQLSGTAAPSTTVLRGRVAIRCAIVNHRTTHEDIDRLVQSVLERGRERAAALA